jgi:hypothetical protein
LESLKSEAVAGGSLRKFAAGNATAPNFQTLYALVQCTPDLSELECNNCLAGAFQGILNCCDGKQGGRVISPSCSMRFEVEQFYNLIAAASPPSSPVAPPLSPPPPLTNTNTTSLFWTRRTWILGLETRRTEHSLMAMTCAPKRAFRIGVICANRILVAEVMAKLLQRTQKLLQLGLIMISCQFCADLPAPGISAPLMCNLTAHCHLTRILLHQDMSTQPENRLKVTELDPCRSSSVQASVNEASITELYPR